MQKRMRILFALLAAFILYLPSNWAQAGRLEDITRHNTDRHDGRLYPHVISESRDRRI